jgi:hypothetical protein
MFWLKGQLISLKTMTMLVIKTLEFEPLSVQSWANSPYVNIFNLGEPTHTLILL